MADTDTTRRGRPTNTSSWTPKTPYQEWLQPRLSERGWSAGDLAREIGREQAIVWRIVNGDPTKHPSAKRPGYELAYQIGEKLGSVAESMKAAGHSLDHSTEINSQPFSNQFERICKEIVSDEDIREIITKLVQQAKEGNTEAVKILLDR